MTVNALILTPQSLRPRDFKDIWTSLCKGRLQLSDLVCFVSSTTSTAAKITFQDSLGTFFKLTAHTSTSNKGTQFETNQPRVFDIIRYITGDHTRPPQ
jgi:hypothetical protein